MGRIRIGLSSWTDQSLIDGGKFYPSDARDAEGRLRFYAAHFPDLVEVNSTYYGLPSERNSYYWDQRTPAGFLFDVKMHALLTQHPAETRSLPKDLVARLDEKTRTRKRLYFDDVPREVAEEVVGRFVLALKPLYLAGKLGAILLQFPHWVHPGPAGLEHIAWVRARLRDYQVAVEFRNHSWLDEEHREATFGFLREQSLTYVCVDEPQGLNSSVPPIAEVTNPMLAYVRFHGRRRETWEKSGVTVQERYKYLYSDGELKEWIPRIERLADGAQEVHVLMNTNYDDFAVRNGRQLRLMLGE